MSGIMSEDTENTPGKTIGSGLTARFHHPPPGFSSWKGDGCFSLKPFVTL